MKARGSTLLVALGIWLAPIEARASNNLAGCFQEAKSFAVCNGFVAGIAGLGSMGLATASLLARPENEHVGYIAGGVAAGMYSAISGSALLAMSESLPPDDTLKDTSRILGAVDLAAGSAGLVMIAIAGVKVAMTDPPQEDDDDDVALFIGPGVSGFSGPATGLTVTLSF